MLYQNKVIGYIGKEPIYATLEEDNDAYMITLACVDKKIICFIPKFELMHGMRGERNARYILNNHVKELALQCLTLQTDVVENIVNEIKEES